ncbi:hypothetical protein [Vulgatibacter incomptus]|uniref:Uncharacterized protein n=1 Tax=Vulgatibacter incomptus TaxID=1391653 RepID=A0A0K1P9H7_9BACT|nr:hypothetical protein [Vulgatibacter incomptus]AKU90081.1 hypothetical protein AKJ08_0468 [Vulgatibacter incomptus]
MTKKTELDARRVLDLLRDPEGNPRSIAEKVGASPEAVDEARCLADEIADAELDAILAMPPVLGRALLRAAAQADRLEVLVEAAAQGDKELQKEAKRLAHALKQRGVEVGLPARPAPEPRPATEAAGAAEPPVYLSSLDAFGERAVFWTRTLPGRGIELAQIVVSDTGGVADFLLGELSRKRFRELADELPRKGGVTILEVGRDEARIALNRARVAARKGGACPTDFPSWAAQVLGPIPAETPPPLAPRGEGRPPDDKLHELVAESETLFAEPELSRWFPPREEIQAFSTRLEAVHSSPLYLEGPQGDLQREEALATAVEREADRYFDDRRRGLFAGWLLDTARLFEATGRVHRSQVAASTARMLASGAPVQRIPFCRAFFGRMLEKRPSEARHASSLLFTPDKEGTR